MPFVQENELLHLDLDLDGPRAIPVIDFLESPVQIIAYRLGDLACHTHELVGCIDSKRAGVDANKRVRGHDALAHSPTAIEWCRTVRQLLELLK